MTPFVREKSEGRGTVAKAGLFWAIIAIPVVLWRRAQRKREQKHRWFRRG